MPPTILLLLPSLSELAWYATGTQRVRFVGVAGRRQPSRFGISIDSVKASITSITGSALAPRKRLQHTRAQPTAARRGALCTEGSNSARHIEHCCMVPICSFVALIYCAIRAASCSDSGASTVCPVVKANPRLCNHTSIRSRCKRTCGDCQCSDSPPAGESSSYCHDMLVSSLRPICSCLPATLSRPRKCGVSDAVPWLPR